MESRRKFLRGSAKSTARRAFAFMDAVMGAEPERANPKETQSGNSDRRWLRPPGALDEKAFMDTCTRCDACVAACPHQAIRKAKIDLGREMLGTPIIIPHLAACKLCKSLACIPVCEPEALLPVTREEVRMGLAKLEASKCYVSQGQPCDYCLTKCPLKRQAITPDDNGVPIILEDGCTGCGVCVEWCPTEAIEVIPF